MNDDNYYKEQLNQLSVKVDELTAYKQKNFDIYNKINPMYIYISVPILTFLILYVTKPDIIMVKVKDGNTFFTETKISYLTSPINLNDTFWKIPITEYHIPQVGILKKQMKMISATQVDLDIINEKLKSEKCIDQHIINSIINRICIIHVIYLCKLSVIPIFIKPIINILKIIRNIT